MCRVLPRRPRVGSSLTSVTPEMFNCGDLNTLVFTTRPSHEYRNKVSPSLIPDPVVT